MDIWFWKTILTALFLRAHCIPVPLDECPFPLTHQKLLQARSRVTFVFVLSLPGECLLHSEGKLSME